MAIIHPKLSGAANLVANYPMPSGAKWANDIRINAITVFNIQGAPHKRDEYWRYTDPSELTVVPTKPAALFSNDESPMFDLVDCIRIVFVDGIIDTDRSDDLSLSGASIEVLTDVTSTDIH